MWVLWLSFSRRNERANGLMPWLIDGRFIVSAWLCPTSMSLLFLLYPYHLVIFLESEVFLLLFVVDEFPEPHLDSSTITPYWLSTWQTVTVPRIMLPGIRVYCSIWPLLIYSFKILVYMVLFLVKSHCFDGLMMCSAAFGVLGNFPKLTLIFAKIEYSPVYEILIFDIKLEQMVLGGSIT